jgi:ligand-binding sensor domain-containing protein
MEKLDEKWSPLHDGVSHQTLWRDKDGSCWLVSSVNHTLAQETMVFEATEDGTVLSWLEEWSGPVKTDHNVLMSQEDWRNYDPYKEMFNEQAEE